MVSRLVPHNTPGNVMHDFAYASIETRVRVTTLHINTHRAVKQMHIDPMPYGAPFFTLRMMSRQPGDGISHMSSTIWLRPSD